VTPERGGTFLASFGSSDFTQLIPGFRATFAPPDHLLYVRDRTLIAQRINIQSGRLDGAPMTIPGDVPASALISASRDGSVLAVTAGNVRQRLVWLDRQGKQVGMVNAPTPLADLALSPNGRLALAATLDAGSYELWLVDLERNVSTKVATDGTFPAWAPDGSRFAYTLVGPEGADLYIQATSGTPQPMAWLKTKELKAVNSWSPDGRYIVFSKYTTRDQTSQDIWLLPATGDNRKPIPYVQTKAREREGRLSPDGRWMAYTSDETGTNEIYVQSFPTPGLKVRVSNGGGTQPLWRQDGRELFYVSLDHRVVSVPLSPGANFAPGAPQPLFALPSVSTAQRTVESSLDGQRFLAVDWDVAREESRITVLTNWEAARKP
jgi:eukaryotic-like serine/threonine-protein kinase